MGRRTRSLPAASANGQKGRIGKGTLSPFSPLGLPIPLFNIQTFVATLARPEHNEIICHAPGTSRGRLWLTAGTFWRQTTSKTEPAEWLCSRGDQFQLMFRGSNQTRLQVADGAATPS